MRIALLSNLLKDKALETTKNIIQKLNELNIDIYMLKQVKPQFAEFKYINYIADMDMLLPQTDIVCVLGGDGTIIKIAKQAAHFNKSVLGINLGEVGFLANIEPDDLDKLNSLLKQNYTFEERTMLDVSVKTNEKQYDFVALNDIVITRKYPAKVIRLDIARNNTRISNYNCDGAIVTTPTGSTAYSLSAGGPVIEPNCECMMITPICPHTLDSRSIIIDANSCVTLKPNLENDKSIFLNVDGDISIELTHDVEVIITKSNLVAKFIKINNVDFFSLLNSKLSESRN